MYLYDYSLDAGTRIIKFLVLTKLEKWPSESLCKDLLPQFLLVGLNSKVDWTFPQDKFWNAADAEHKKSVQNWVLNFLPTFATSIKIE